MSQQILSYLSKQPSPQKELLEELRAFLKKLLPLAEESLSYGVPAFKYQGKSLLYAAFKNHLGLYPEPEAMTAFAKELTAYRTAKGTIQFPLDQPLPYDLIEKIVRYKFKI
jgi:uncharacterized protein YdhG (YjbR/CyaY superfamily)